MEALLDSRATGLVMSSEFTKKQGFKLKKLERLMNVRNMDRSLNKEGPIENMVEVNIYYKGHRERTEIDVIGGQKWTVILKGIPVIKREKRRSTGVYQRAAEERIYLAIKVTSNGAGVLCREERRKKENSARL